MANSTNYSYSYIEALEILNRDICTEQKEILLKPSWKLLNDSAEVVFNGVPFALTGSRYFQYFWKSCNPQVDWDFFTPYSLETENYLKSLDPNIYILYSNASDYKDTDVVKVYRHTHGDTQVDIQLVKDYNRRLVIRDVLKNMYLPWEHIQKNVRSNLWNAMYTLSALPGI